MKREDIEFLKELQQEILNQETDFQASPRYWGLRQVEELPTGYDWAERIAYMHVDGDASEFETLGELIEFLSDYEAIGRDDLDKVAEFETLEEAFEYVCNYLNPNGFYYEVPLMKVEKLIPNTFFLTKAEAKEHIARNGYRYNGTVHTYAMTVFRAPKVEKLYKILEETNFDKMLEEVANENS